MSLKINTLTVELNSTKIVKKIDFFAKEGEISVISGPNGSGKSTLIKTIMGIHKTPKNKIFIDDIDITDLKTIERAKKIAYISQFNSNNFDYTVREIVEMGRYPHKDKKYINESMELTGVRNLENREVSTLSGGELQRVLLARSLAVKPQYLILDEPSSNLDISHNVDIMNLIKDLSRKFNITTIMVLHDLNTIYRYSDSVTLLKDGFINFSGPTKESLTVESIKNVFNVDVDFIVDKSGKTHIVFI